MPLRMLQNIIEGHDAPTLGVFCDHCDTEVEHAVDGNYQWIAEHDGGVVSGSTLVFTHKRCAYEFELAHAGRAGRIWGGGELVLLPGMLALSLKQHPLPVPPAHPLTHSYSFSLTGKSQSGAG